MPSPTTSIRLQIKASLLGRTVAANNVESSRKAPVSQEPSALIGNNNELARIVIWTRQTTSRVFDESPRRYRNEDEVIVECLRQFTPPAAIDDDIDEIEDQVLRILLSDDTLGGLVDDFQRTESVRDYGDVGDRIIGGVAMTFRATYYTTAPMPNTQDLDDLITVDTGYNLAGDQPDPLDRAQTIIVTEDISR